jgi:hypothetical protein
MYFVASKTAAGSIQSGKRVKRTVMRTISLNKKHYYLLAFVAVAAAASMLFALGSTANAQGVGNTSQAVGANFAVAAGFADNANEGFEIEEFLPEKITVREGDSIT